MKVVYDPEVEVLSVLLSGARVAESDRDSSALASAAALDWQVAATGRTSRGI